jgi:DNA-directed RNA polymerase subunit H
LPSLYSTKNKKKIGEHLAEERHYLVPEHVLIRKEKVQELMDELGINKISLPIITRLDPAIKPLKAEKGDVVKIIRDSLTAGQATYYRRIV